MKYITAQIEWQGHRIKSIPIDYVLHIRPAIGYDHGRKALHMAQLWARVRPLGCQGVLWLDPDVAADPDDLGAMLTAVRARPGDMHTGLVKLWPASTGRPEWMWSHRPGKLGFPVATQDEAAQVAYVATGFLWTPARLLDVALPVMAGWQWIEVDVGLSELALRHGIPAHTVPGCRPKHLHF